MIAVVAEKVVAGALEDARSVIDDVCDFFLRQDGKAMEDLAAKGATGRLEFRSCPVDSTDAFPIVTAVGIFFGIDDYTRV